MTGSLVFIAMLLAAAFGVHSCTQSDWYKADIAKYEADKQAATVPRIVSRSADGCEVYAFNPGDRWRYFTRCGAQTTTDNSYTVTRTSGKTTTTETVDDSITTVRSK
jgi:hypothetical protein